jgi:hypothetical protein
MYLCYTLHIVKAKENSKELLWQIIGVGEEWCSEWGYESGKSRNRR